jgi:hypothetical protein
VLPFVASAGLASSVLTTIDSIRSSPILRTAPRGDRTEVIPRVPR